MYLCMPVEENLRCCSLSSTLFETKSLVLHLPFCCRNTDFKHSLLCLGLHTVLAGYRGIVAQDRVILEEKRTSLGKIPPLD